MHPSFHPQALAVAETTDFPSMAAPSQGLTLRPRLKWVQQDNDDWEAMYPHIQRLYIEQGRRLDDVISVMEREHDFRAT